MCGIFGYIGKKDPVSVCLFGLKQLEYRGYDSAGIAGMKNGAIRFCKEVGKINVLEKKIALSQLQLDLAIGHTRWATHGKPTNVNAHPHFDECSTIALVHNGIIENYDALRNDLISKGLRFQSETDTEVIVQLISMAYQGDILKAVQQTLLLLKGSFAIALIHVNHPNEMIVAARESPLSIGYDDDATESIISSDPNAFLSSSPNVIYLRNDELARIQAGHVTVYDAELRAVDKGIHRLEAGYHNPSKGEFAHFLLKEIFEQPKTIAKTFEGRLNAIDGYVEFEPLRISESFFRKIDYIWLLGCGTSAHAGWLATLLFEDIAEIPSSVEIASEARYRHFLLPKNTLVIAISQSGETADTIAAMREAQKRGFPVLGICNVANSTLSREADATIFLKAGPEMSVCSSKAFTSQLSVLTMLAYYFARLKNHWNEERQSECREMQKIPEQIEKVLKQTKSIEKIAKKYAHYDDFFFMGRRYMLPTCMEAALKLKEISYTNANGYPAGELKHGPIALLHSKFPVIAFSANHQTEDKLMSNLMEVKARGAPVLTFACESSETIIKISDDVVLLPKTIDTLSPFSSIVAAQLFAYYVAKERGCDIDQPRNLAKSVTVE